MKLRISIALINGVGLLITSYIASGMFSSPMPAIFLLLWGVAEVITATMFYQRSQDAGKLGASVAVTISILALTAMIYIISNTDISSINNLINQPSTQDLLKQASNVLGWDPTTVTETLNYSENQSRLPHIVQLTTIVMFSVIIIAELGLAKFYTKDVDE